MTVREAFSKAFGPVPDDAMCHYAYRFLSPHVVANYCDGAAIFVQRNGGWSWRDYDTSNTLGPDIADRPAEAFLGFFGDEYDRVVNEATPQPAPASEGRGTGQNGGER